MFKNNRDCGGKTENYHEMNKGYNQEIMSMGYGEMMGGIGCNNSYPGVVCPPVYECPQEKVCHRYICHEVPHIQPCNTRIVNHHVYRHTFTPC